MAEGKKGTPVEKWDEVNGREDMAENKVRDMDRNGEEQNVQMRSIEDMLEQNDNQLDGVINNVSIETEAEKEAKSSVVDKLKATNSEKHCTKCHHPTDREAR